MLTCARRIRIGRPSWVLIAIMMPSADKDHEYHWCEDDLGTAYALVEGTAMELLPFRWRWCICACRHGGEVAGNKVESPDGLFSLN